MILMASLTGIGAVFAGLGIIGGIGMLAQLGDSFDKIGSGMSNFANGLSQIKSITSDLAGMGDSGFLAVKSDGTATSMVMGSGGVMQNFVDGKMTVDVKIPEISMPEITVNVYVDKKGNVDVIKTIAGS